MSILSQRRGVPAGLSVGAWAGPWVLLVLLVPGGCTVGHGEGWVTGRLWVDNCDEGSPLGNSPSDLADYDLQADSFFGEVMEDSNAVPSQRRNALVIRIQDTSNNVEDTNGVMFQLLDLDRAARAMAQGEPLPVTANDLCRDGTGCDMTDDAVRGRLYLYATCPTSTYPMIASSQVFTSVPLPSGTSGGTCLKSSVAQPAKPCPTLTAGQKKQLDDLCDGDFTDRTQYDVLSQLLGNGACMYPCRLGDVQRGQDVTGLQGVAVTYGDEVAALFSVTLVDGRAVELGGCARSVGELRGMFSFEVERGRAGQSFP